MTLEQLKRHTDRRFDRLQRTKADKADLKRFATKSQVRGLRREIALRPTKDDLKGELARHATKDDLKRELARYATKDDLKRELAGYATKDDLKRELARYATKDDLKRELARCATKDDLQRYATAAEMNRRFDSLDDKLNSMLKRLVDVVDTHGAVLREHDLRLQDLERATNP